MSVYGDNQRIKVDGIGTGATFRSDLFVNGVYNKTLEASIPTTSGQPFTTFIDNEVANNSWEIGTNVTVILIETSVPTALDIADLVTNHNDKIGKVIDLSNIIHDTASDDFTGTNPDEMLPMPHSEGSFALTAQDRLYQVSAADGKPCAYVGDDPVQAQIAEWAQAQPDPPVSGWIFNQPTVSLRPVQKYNTTVNRNVVVGGQLEATPPGVVNNPNYFEFTLAMATDQNLSGVTISLGLTANSQRIYVGRNGIQIFGAVVSYSAVVPANEMGVYRVKIPKNSSFNSGDVPVFSKRSGQPEQLIATVSNKPRDPLVQNGSIVSVRASTNTNLACLFFEPSELTAPFNANAVTNAAIIGGVTI